MTFEEYRDTSDGSPDNAIKWPVRIRITASGQDLLFVATDVKLNEPVDDAVFALPEDVRDLTSR
jgi:hypothetical protein